MKENPARRIKKYQNGNVSHLETAERYNSHQKVYFGFRIRSASSVIRQNMGKCHFLFTYVGSIRHIIHKALSLIHVF